MGPIYSKRASSRAQWLAIAAMWLTGALAVSSLSGCQLLFAIGEMMFPTQKIPARFTLPKGQAVLVFPDDLEIDLSYPPVRHRLAEKISRVLTDKKLVNRAIPYNKISELRSAEPDFNQLAVSTIGQKLGATLVIYINIREFRLKDQPIESFWSGKFAADVWIVEVKTGDRIWSSVDPKGRPITVSERPVEDSSSTYGTKLAHTLADRLAVEIAGLFHSHRVERNRLPPGESPFD